MEKSDVIAQRQPDIIVYDPEENEVLVVEVRLKIPQDILALKRGIEHYIRSARYTNRAAAPFAMLIDTKVVQVMKWQTDNLSEPILELNSDEIFSYYDSDFGSKRIFEYYLTALAESWLRDFSFHWKHQQPPKEEELSKIGLLPLLENSWAKSIEDK
ncbi:hypothetical protein [Gloeobacter kilaueensis]|nr:hypothetical protein [Gloeobacter kilaueensis]